ncbi:hypothetical protein BWQ96_00443 [Gracilariopsis chorda]|uniref:Uncharacterized protein n=1 Tax=Gracilariopsis chorda TaxID=448386 RepID=A0A2V3J5U2_9FLOR|nr:hypothetical protein BWQ96_00443 [Gracilariopsis chorda]|eukprot:PXF49791.1 hypothetical protein BWQ96_00443 [Gracilariopsis chorda]
MWEQSVEVIEANRNAALQLNIEDFEQKEIEHADGDEDEENGEETTRINFESISGHAFTKNSNALPSDYSIKDSVVPRKSTPSKRRLEGAKKVVDASKTLLALNRGSARIENLVAERQKRSKYYESMVAVE